MNSSSKWNHESECEKREMAGANKDVATFIGYLLLIPIIVAVVGYVLSNVV